jgi:hypothetical protein
MTFVVEDGTGRTDANAFISVAYFEAYCDARGHNISAFSELQIEQGIVRASSYLSDSFHYKGWRVRGRNSSLGAQALSWPRSYVEDGDGYSVPSDEVPDEIERATAEVTRRELTTPGFMTPDVIPANQKILTEVAGIKWTSLAMPGPQGAVPVLTVVRDIIGPLLDSGGGSLVQGSAVRV